MAFFRNNWKIAFGCFFCCYTPWYDDLIYIFFRANLSFLLLLLGKSISFTFLTGKVEDLLIIRMSIEVPHVPLKLRIFHSSYSTLYDLPIWPFYSISCFDVFHLATLLRKVPNSVWKKILEFDQLTMTEGCEIKNDPRLFYLFCLNFKIQTQ